MYNPYLIISKIITVICIVSTCIVMFITIKKYHGVNNIVVVKLIKYTQYENKIQQSHKKNVYCTCFDDYVNAVIVLISQE